MGSSSFASSPTAVVGWASLSRFFVEAPVQSHRAFSTGSMALPVPLAVAMVRAEEHSQAHFDATAISLVLAPSQFFLRARNYSLSSPIPSRTFFHFPQLAFLRSQ